MSILILLLAVAIAITALSKYLTKASEYLDASVAPWDRMYVAAKAAIDDETMPQRAVNFAIAAVVGAGCGCITSQVLIDTITGRLSRRSRRSTSTAYDEMTPAQRKIMADVAVNAIYYDSLRAPMRGFIVRRICMPWLKGASEGASSARRKSAVVEIMESASRVIEDRASTRIRQFAEAA